MKQISFVKNLIILIIGIMATLLLVAEGDTWRTTVLIKAIACALIGIDVLLYRQWIAEDKA